MNIPAAFFTDKKGEAKMPHNDFKILENGTVFLNGVEISSVRFFSVEQEGTQAPVVRLSITARSVDIQRKPLEDRCATEPENWKVALAESNKFGDRL